MSYELSDERNLKKVLGIAAYVSTGLLTGSTKVASFAKDKVEKARDFLDDASDKTTISGIVEDIVGKSWEDACSGYDIPIECRRELAQYNIMNNLDEWASISTIRYNIARICSKYNVRLNTIDPGDIASKLLRSIVFRVDDNPFLKTREYIFEVNEKLDIIVDFINDRKGNNPKLYGRLMEMFINQRGEHPSIRMMTPDSGLFPIGIPAITSSNRAAFEGDKGPFSIKEMILKSWEEHKKKHILLVGKGGIGKTVAMLTIPLEDWIRPYNIPAIYVPLNLLENCAGNLNEYIRNNYPNDIDGIIELANSSWMNHPNLLLLLDGFNEIPMKDRRTAERHISEWMDKPGVQIITTSRISFFLDNDFAEYVLQPLPYEVVKRYLISSGTDETKLPSEDDNIWKVINVPLMMVIYMRIDKVKERTNKGAGNKYLEWKDSENAAHIIWNYLQVELYRHISVLKTASVLSAASILAIAPYVCFEMTNKGKFRVEQEEFKGLIRKAVQFFNENQLAIPEQISYIRYRFDRNSEERPFDENSVATHFSVLTDQSVLFQTMEEKKDEKPKIYYVLSHQNFRDALAAIFTSTSLLNICKHEYREGLSKKILDAVDYYVKNYISEFLSKDELINIWNHHRKNEPGNGRMTWILMDIIGRKRNYDYSELDFSGLDLTNTKLYGLISKHKGLCPLPRKAVLFNKTKIRMDSILPDGNIIWVRCVSYSPDGRHVAIGLGDGTIRIRDLESGETRTLKGHAYELRSVSYSPDGRHVASGSDDETVRIWDLESGEAQILEGHIGVITSVSYSPDGRHIASGSYDRTVRIWDLESGEARILEGHTSDVESVSYSPDGRHVASGSGDRTVRIWDLESGEARILEGHTSTVVSVSYSSDGRHIASGSNDGTVRIWDLESGEAQILEGHTSVITSVSYSPDGRHVASGSWDNTVRIWDLESGEARILEGHTSAVESVSYSPDGRHVASGLDDETVRIWDTLGNHTIRVNRIIPSVNLNGVNLEKAIIPKEEKELFKECGAII